MSERDLSSQITIENAWQFGSLQVTEMETSHAFGINSRFPFTRECHPIHRGNRSVPGHALALAWQLGGSDVHSAPESGRASESPLYPLFRFM